MLIKRLRLITEASFGRFHHPWSFLTGAQKRLLRDNKSPVAEQPLLPA